MIREVIVVEGKDDIAKVKGAIDCEVVATGGYAFGESFLDDLRKMEEKNGVIIFTDPDFMGKKIRERLEKALVNPKHAFLPQEKATLDEDIGIENASYEDIRAALREARPKVKEPREEFTRADLIRYGLMGAEGAEERRADLGAYLGIGHGNGKQFLNRLNHFGITREEVERGLEAVEDDR